MPRDANAGSYNTCTFSFSRNWQLFSSGLPFCISIINVWLIQFPTSLLAFNVVTKFCFSYFIGVISNYMCNLHFLIREWCHTCFHVLICHLCILVKCLFIYFAYVHCGFFVGFTVEFWEIFMYLDNSFCQMCDLQIFSLSL